MCELIVIVILGNPFWPNFNYYDIRLPCESLSGCYPEDGVSSLMNSLDFRQYIGADEENAWEVCKTLPYLFLRFDEVKMYGNFLKDILDSGDIDVLIYHGDKDFICNWRGGEAWTEALVWKH
mmetsp:Transcript_38376/g.36739  ORF Transcript_38376/g.36739 Transcript_38376/m.36739 type:complete len:122 (-) Transcript_38376:252-617(-)